MLQQLFAQDLVSTLHSLADFTPIWDRGHLSSFSFWFWVPILGETALSMTGGLSTILGCRPHIVADALGIGMQDPEVPSQRIQRSMLLHFTLESFPEFLLHLTYATFPTLQLSSSWLVLFLLENEGTSLPAFQSSNCFCSGTLWWWQDWANRGSQDSREVLSSAELERVSTGHIWEDHKEKRKR